jgi:hypothetical protein
MSVIFRRRQRRRKRRFITSAQDDVDDEEFLDEDDEEEGIGEIDDGKTGKLTLGALLQVPVSLKNFCSSSLAI